MQLRVRSALVGAALVAVALCGEEAQTVTAAQKCQAGKNKVAGKYAACRHGAEAKLATTGDGVTYAAVIGTCTAKHSAAWQKLETDVGGACPSNGDEIPVENVVGGCAGNVATGVGGGALSDCPADLILSIHDKDDVYTWTPVFAGKVATLTSTSFAG